MIQKTSFLPIFCTCKTGYAILTKDVFECGALASMHFPSTLFFSLINNGTENCKTIMLNSILKWICNT